ncbi:MAG: UbiX family flavin prenyltransferase [Candidatus Tectomicrobia bacterium]|uniref:Flavin prenyltransferase UbiX n=1 Tax=Tectimicrobiota bacterium TaxID=2528274 RepID=A0A932I3V5_UNCTE|nr:UbiX family flavin prenyltransferase [Candidatus Tectomicrobia bacterium]
MKLVVGITGASGALYGVRFMEVLREAYPDVETHLVISKAGLRVLQHETGLDLKDLGAWASVVHPEGDIGARPASGSAGFDAMAVIPCSMKTLGQIAAGTGDNLVGRAADVILKEGRRLVLVPREMPLSAIHLENMLKLSRLGVMILPASPGFYFGPKTLDDLVNHVVGKTLDSLGLEQKLFERWKGQFPERRGGAVPERRAETN